VDGKDVRIVSAAWGDHDNRDGAFIPLVWTIRNRIDTHYAPGGTYDFQECDTISNCARSKDYEAYYANREYTPDAHEIDVATRVLNREIADPTGGATFFYSRDTGCPYPTYRVDNLTCMDENVKEALKDVGTWGFDFCTLEQWREGW
jgi:hypothetical protein